VCKAIPSNGQAALAVLDKTSFDMYTQSFSGFGRSICWLDGEGHVPPADCFDTGASAANWGVWVQGPNKTAPHPTGQGVSTLKLVPGSILYMQFAVFDPNTFQQPAPTPVTFASICNT
jgi:hypothetical protein